MTGPEHFRAAEKYLATAASMDPMWSDDEHRASQLAAAQAHATLALAAATALQWHLDLLSVDPDSPGSAWRQVIA